MGYSAFPDRAFPAAESAESPVTLQVPLTIVVTDNPINVAVELQNPINVAVEVD